MFFFEWLELFVVSQNGSVIFVGKLAKPSGSASPQSQRLIRRTATDWAQLSHMRRRIYRGDTRQCPRACPAACSA